MLQNYLAGQSIKSIGIRFVYMSQNSALFHSKILLIESLFAKFIEIYLHCKIGSYQIFYFLWHFSFDIVFVCWLIVHVMFVSCSDICEKTWNIMFHNFKRFIPFFQNSNHRVIFLNLKFQINIWILIEGIAKKSVILSKLTQLSSLKEQPQKRMFLTVPKMFLLKVS